MYITILLCLWLLFYAYWSTQEYVTNQAADDVMGLRKQTLGTVNILPLNAESIADSSQGSRILPTHV